MTFLLILVGNFFVMIICLIGVQAAYFKRRWKWFFLMLVCVIASAVCIGLEVYQWVTPAPQELPLVIRQPTTPL